MSKKAKPNSLNCSPAHRQTLVALRLRLPVSSWIWAWLNKSANLDRKSRL
jgi:hypothetical protein